MSKQASPTLIGAFVVGAITLLAVAVMLFGGTELFARESRFVAYFPESVKGLRVGANVLFRGVRIGFVEELQLFGDVDTLQTQVQVTMRLFPNLFQLTRKGVLVETRTDELYSAQELIDAGMYAQLGVESFVTGQLLVEVDIVSGVVGDLRGDKAPYPEIPTVPNDIQQLVDDVRSFVADLQKEIDVNKLARDIQTAVSGVSDLANSQELRDALAGLSRIINAEDTQLLTTRVGETLATANSAFADARQLVNNADTKIDSLAEDLRPAVAQLSQTLTTAEHALENAALQLEGDSELANQINGTLHEIESAVRSLRVFLDYIERNPEALVRGKRP